MKLEQLNRALPSGYYQLWYSREEILQALSLAFISRFEKEDLFGKGKSE